MKGTGKMKRLLAMLLCVMQLFGCIPHLDAHGEVQTHTHAHAEECAHQVDNSNAWWSYELAEGSNWTANDDGKTHSALAYAVYESNCALCGKYFVVSREETPQVYDDYHDYNSEGVCYACGYENTCEHPEEYFNSWFYFSLADGAQWTANDDGKNHSALAYKITRGRCDLCKMYFDISRDETPHVYTEEHYYEDGVCQSCGAENSCEHPESYISTWYGYELDAGEKWTANKDGKTHSAKAIKRVGIFCELCGMDLEVTEDESPVLYTVEHDYFNSNICDDCGYENSCEHPIAYLNIWTDYELVDDIEWTINDDGTHTGNCYEFTVTNCNLCGQYTRTRGEAKVRTLPHEFYRNICQYCGVLNSCTHPNATTYTQVEYHTDLAADNGLTHTGIGTLYESGWCADCQSNLNKTVLDNNYSLTEQHYMTNGICDVCGYKTLCDHPTTDVFGSFRNGRNYTQKDETYHTGVYDYYETTYCTVCESNLTTQFVEANKTHDSMHIFLDDGTCFNCGYLNTCTHDGEPATYTAYYDYSSNVTFTEATHSYTATKYYELYCDVCGTVLEYTETPNTTVTEEHKFNTSGVCIICGYGSDSVCTHENAEHTGGNQKNQTVVINENGTHTRTFDVYWEYTCPDCGEEFETFIEQGSETEPHVAGGKPNVCVVCGSAMCERHYYRDGKCIRCGYENACTHENAIFEEDGRNENTVIVDNKDGTHTRTFDVYLYYACPDCEESCAIYEEQGVETEPHEYPNGVNCQCGKLKPCETHDWSNLDGECRVCGTACEHGFMISTADTRYCHYCGYTQYHDWSDKSGFCTICGFACDNIGHIYENSICTKCGYSCIHYYWDRESGTCATCGMICKHEKTYIDDDEEIISEITAVNGLYHSWRENQFEKLTCSICRKVLGTTIIKENVERTLYHDTFYNTGSCNSCGYEFLCDHTNVEVEYKYDQAGPITEVDENSHQGEFVLVSKNRCTDCGILLNYTETIEFTNTIQPHEYINGICRQCDRVNTCTHDADTYEKLTPYAPYDMVCIDETNHSYKSLMRVDTYCSLCNEKLDSVRDVVNTFTEPHSRNSEGVCVVCLDSTDLSCTHENAEHTGGNQKNQTVVINENGTHTRTFDVYWEYTCPDCGEEFETFIEQGSETEPHVAGGKPNVCVVCGSAMCERHFYRDGKCIRCGYENACTHENAIFEEDGRNENTVIVDNKDGTHTRTFDVYLYYACPDCEESCAIYEEQGVETEPHEYPNGVSCQCGKLKPCEVHDWTNLDGVCRVCGMTCDHTLGWRVNVDARYCSCCGFTQYHDWSDKSGSCTICGLSCYVFGNGHTFENSICTRCGYSCTHYWNHENDTCSECGKVCEHNETETDEEEEIISEIKAVNGLYHSWRENQFEELTCSICRKVLGTTIIKENVEETQYHIVSDDSGICSRCGYEFLCDHTNTEIEYWYLIYDTAYPVDEYTHQGEGICTEIARCTDCSLILGYSQTNEYKNLTLPHEFEDGICYECGYVSTCTHNADTYEKLRAIASRDMTCVDENNHSYQTYALADIYCSLCNSMIDSGKVRTLTITEPHSKNSEGICVVCLNGKNLNCTHENKTQTGGNQKNQTVVINENGTHTRTFDVYWEYTCLDCFESFETFIEQGSETEPHVAGGNPNVCVICGSDMCERHYYRDGKCIECGYENDCTHANAVFAEDGRQKNTVTVNNGNGTHTRTFDVYHFYDCPDCEEAYAIFTGAGSETEAHVAGGNPNVCVICGSGMCERHYYRDGKCIECGYENDCAHTNAVFAEDGRNKNTVFTDINNDTHTRTFDVYHFYDCPDCEEAYAIFMDQGSETEAHEYPNGVNCQCGKLKPCETHDWSNLDGVCSVCGNNCTHPQDGLIYSTTYELADGAEWIADENGTTHTAMAVKVVRKYCSNCYLETEDYRDETAQLYSVDHSFLSDGYCYHCGYECPHENKTQTGGDQQSMVIGDVGNGEHIRAFDVYWIYHCPDCNATIEQYIERGYEIEPHTYFGDGEHCDTCGAAQNCSHIRNGDYLDYEMFAEDPQPHNEEFHLNPYTTYMRYQCTACNGSFMHISRMENLEGHQFGADGFCACGAQGEPMTCQHENIDFRYCEENVVYTDITDQQHTKTYDLYFYTWCPDCETRRVYYLEAPNQTTTEDHDFSNGACACGYLPTIPDCERHYYLDGMCIECGHENLCAHTNAVFAEDGRQKNTVTVNNGNGTHTRTFDVYHFYDCPDCEESYAIFTGQGSETEAHVSGGNPTVCVVCGSAMCERHFYRDGKCIRCGYENACTHENAIFEEDGRNENTVIVDNKDGTHTRTFDVYLYYACPDCEESCAIYEEQGIETEPHEYPNGVSCQCGKRKPCDAHNFVSGECTACGHLALEGMEHVIVLPSALKTIEKEAFAGSAADAFVVPDGCTTIGSRAFAQCDSLKCIILPGSATQIADDAFDGCEGVTILAPQGSAAHALAGELNFTWHNAQ